MYRFKKLQELAWAIFVSVAIAVGMELLTFDVALFSENPWAFLAAVIGGSARAIGGALLATFKPEGSSDSDVPTGGVNG